MVALLPMLLALERGDDFFRGHGTAVPQHLHHDGLGFRDGYRDCGHRPLCSFTAVIERYNYMRKRKSRSHHGEQAFSVAICNSSRCAVPIRRYFDRSSVRAADSPAYSMERSLQ